MIAIRCNDSRGAGWLAAREGDVLRADGWECSSDHPHSCGRGLYGWQVHPAPKMVQGEGWTGARVTDPEWVAWEPADPAFTAILQGKVATYSARIVKAACDPIAMLAWIRGQGYYPTGDLERAAAFLTRIRWGWTVRLATIVTHEAVYRLARTNGWPLTREAYVNVMRCVSPHNAPAEWAYPLSVAVATGGWTDDGAPVPGVASEDAEEALRDGTHVGAALLVRLVRAYRPVVREFEIRRAIAAGHASAEREVKALHAARLAARLGKCKAIDLSASAEVHLRPAERGEASARTERRTIAVWYRGAVIGWVTPYRAGQFWDGTTTTIGALRARAQRRAKVPNRYSRSVGGQSVGDGLVARTLATMGRRGWISERYQSSSGGWGHSADYAMRCVDPVTGAVITTWSYGASPTMEAAIVIIDTDRVMKRGGAR